MRRRLLCLALLLSFTAACGSNDPTSPSDDNPGNGGNGPSSTHTGSMTARIDGVPWTATVTAGSLAGGLVSVSGNDGPRAQLTSISFALPSAVGTVGIAPGSILNGTLVIGSNAWAAGSTLGSGSVTLTTVNAAHVAGTFSLTFVPGAGSSSQGNHAVTNGAFDVTF